MRSSGKIDFFEDGPVITRDSGRGIRVGSILEHDWAWRDITGQITVRGTGAQDPPWTQVGSGPFWAYDFDVNDQCWMAFHIPHDFVPQQPFHLHTHFALGGTDTNPVKWEYSYTHALGFDQAAFDLGTGSTATAEVTPSGVQYQHLIAETDEILLEDITEPDGLLYVRIKRITNGATDNADSCFVMTSDVHYRSNNLGTAGKNPSPGFYADQSES